MAMPTNQGSKTVKRSIDQLPITVQNDHIHRYPTLPLTDVSVDMMEDQISAIEAVEKSTDPKKLVRWAQHPYFYIREAVAANTYSPEEALDILSADPLKYIRELVLNNPNTALGTRLYMRMDGYQNMTLKEFKAVMDKMPSNM